MLDAAAESGTTDIVATPHANTQYSFDPTLITSRIRELEIARPAGPRIHRGCDFHMMFSNLEDALADPAKYAINGKSYLLVEFSDLAIFQSATGDLGRLIGAGLRPIVTHPERNPLLRQRLELLQEWVASGCYLQVTAASYFGRFGSKAERFAEELTRQGLVHFIASDAHDTRHRPPGLRDCHTYIQKRYGAELADRLFVSNPKATLSGSALPAAPPPPATSRRFWFFR